LALPRGRRNAVSSQDPAQQNSAPEQTSAQREYQQYAATDGGEHSATKEPDVLLDVPVLKAGGINLEVRGLRHAVLQIVRPNTYLAIRPLAGDGDTLRRTGADVLICILRGVFADARAPRATCSVLKCPPSR
jgi:hypothetical protein